MVLSQGDVVRGPKKISDQVERTILFSKSQKPRESVSGARSNLHDREHGWFVGGGARAKYKCYLRIEVDLHEATQLGFHIMIPACRFSERLTEEKISTCPSEEEQEEQSRKSDRRKRSGCEMRRFGANPRI